MAHSIAIIPEGVASSDGREFTPGLLTWRETIPLQFQDETTEGHEGAGFVGNITNLRRQTFEGATWIVGDLEYATNVEDATIAFRANAAMELADTGQLAGVSADIATVLEVTGEDEEGFLTFDIVSAEIVGATQLPMPAFAGARILTADSLPVLVAAANPNMLPSWFDDPQLEAPTPFTVTDEGRIYGHLATWGTCHIGFEGVCVTPPDSSSEYAFFHTGEVLGESVGHITMGTGHASIADGAGAAAEHYDNTGTCVADVRCGEDAHGIWVAGATRPDIDVDALRAASLSGDWRRINGNLELVAALAVNVPGFPIPRTQAMVASGEQQSLTASGLLPNAPKTDMDRLIESIDRLTARFEIIQNEQDEPELEPVGDIPPDYGKLRAVVE